MAIVKWPEGNRIKPSTAGICSIHGMPRWLFYVLLCRVWEDRPKTKHGVLKKPKIQDGSTVKTQYGEVNRARTGGSTTQQWVNNGGCTLNKFDHRWIPRSQAFCSGRGAAIAGPRHQAGTDGAIRMVWAGFGGSALVICTLPFQGRFESGCPRSPWFFKDSAAPNDAGWLCAAWLPCGSRSWSQVRIKALPEVV